MKDRQQNSTSYPITFLLVSSTDHITAVTGATPTVTLSKNGAAFAAPAGAVSEIGNGWYQLAGNATDRNTLGVLLLHATATGADPCDDRYNIVPWNPYDANQGLTNLNAPVGSIPTNPFLATSDFNAAQKASLNAATPASVTGSVGSVTSPVAVTGDFSATMKTSLNAATPASVQNIAAQTGDAYARIGAAGAGLTALGDTRIANLDVAVSSRMATFAYTAPDNATIAASNTLLNSGVYGLSAIKTAVAGIPTNPLLAPNYAAPNNAGIAQLITDVENATYGLAAIKAAFGSVTATVDLTPVTGRLDNATYGLAALLAAINSVSGGGSTLTAQQVWDYAMLNGTTAQDLLLRLYIPDYVGPEMVVPVNVDPDVQFVHFYGKLGDKTASVGKLVQAVPQPGQVADQNLIDKEKLTATLDASGYAHLTLICGVTYRISAAWWGATFDITVTGDSNRTFAAYVRDQINGVIPAPAAGAVVYEVK